ncbi:MAG: type III pantothenate kinase [Clostridia bacterium]|nr:type III pantothenate kinase [Clostridia bacterium]
MNGQGTRTGFGIKIKNPEQLGADIVANTTAALAVCEPPLVILDVGTATTLTVVDENRDLLGIVIMPGLKISMSALSLSAAQLSDVRLERPEELIGRDTSSSIRSGVINGQIYAIDGFIRNVREQLHTKESGKSLGLIATGGLANYVLPYMRNKFTYDETLTLSGEVYLFRKNIRSIDG